MAVDWSELIPDLIYEIAKVVPFYEDLLAFVGVCKSWKSVAVEILKTNPALPSRFPCLILPDEEKDVNFRQFFLLSNGGMFRTTQLPEAHNKRCLTSRGWLLMVGEDTNDVKLLHPPRRIQYQLPKLDTFETYEEHNFGDQDFIMKVVLSADPLSSRDFLVMVVWGRDYQVGFCKPGDASWTNIRCDNMSHVYDFSYADGKLFATDGACLGVCDMHCSDPRILTMTFNPSYFCLGEYWFYLCKLPGKDDKLLLVMREGMLTTGPDEVYGEDTDYRTKKFKLFELSCKDATLSKIESLGERALFVGFNATFLMEADDPTHTIKPNCIYFTDDVTERYMSVDEDKRKGGGRDTGIYHLSDGTVEPILGEDLREDYRSCITPPTWVEPPNL